MDFKNTYSDQAEQFRKEVRDWINRTVPADKEFVYGVPGIDELVAGDYVIAKEIQVKLGAKGWLYPTWPREYGGGGLSWEHKFVIDEELARRGVPTMYDPGRLLGGALLAVGTEAQRKKYLPLITRCEISTWQTFTEPEAGSDLASLQSQAIRDGDHFILNGQKTFIGSLHPVDYMLTPAITDLQAPRHQNLSVFVVKADSPGVSTTPLLPIGRPQKNTIYFKDVKVPAENLIGELNKGWDVANLALRAERQAWGGWFRLGNLLNRFIDYCRRTKRGGMPLIEDPQVQQQLADVYLEVKAWELMDARRKWMTIKNIPITYEVSLQTLNMKATILAKFSAMLLDIAGPQVLLTDKDLAIFNGEVEYFERDSIATHGGGTPEIQKLTIARAIGLPSPKRR